MSKKEQIKDVMGKIINNIAKNYNIPQNDIDKHLSNVSNEINKIYLDKKQKSVLKEKEKNYTLRRIVYIIMITSRAILILKNKPDFSKQELSKMLVLMMARNLDDFYFKETGPKEDDVSVTDFFTTEEWTPNPESKLKNKIKERIHKIAAHIVKKKPDPFKNIDEIKDFTLPLLKDSVKFVNECINSRKAKYTEKASTYASKANIYLNKLGISPLLS